MIACAIQNEICSVTLFLQVGLYRTACYSYTVITAAQLVEQEKK